MSRSSTLLRFLVCGLVAASVFVLGGGWLIHHYLGNRPKEVIGMKVVQGINLIKAIPGIAGTAPSAETIESQRQVPGFVQIAFTVGKDGRAHNIHVLRAIPEGMYEQAARKVIKARQFKPPTSGQSAAKQRTEIVHFSAPSKRSTENSKDNSNPDDGG